ncbi:hypothetical protein [Miltoncostaea oceani]|jgi:hypothetical protein|uniref:hypothetical protein n=1 Tax=Miltoncostaea oceani TaxID=2843216 RepID=UPI001C3D1128|nr:hypothetical protein [Miltoncostaea oceani]
MGHWRVVIETRSPAATSRDAFEVTPAPAPGTERAVLAQLVTGIHPGAVERSHVDGRSVFDDGAREISARFEPGDGGGDTPGPAQETLFDT